MSVGYIKLHRSLLDWQYWDDHNTTRLLIYFLVSVNYELKKWKGIEVLPGSMVCSYDKISTATGLSVQQIRRSIKVLVNDNQLIQETTNKFQVVRLVKWEELQLETEIENRQTTDKQQTNNRQTTTTKEVKKEIIKEKNIKKEIPDLNEFLAYAQSIPELSDRYLSLEYSIKAKYETWIANRWKDGYNKEIKNWKLKLKNTLPHLKPLNNLNNATKQQQLTEIGSQLRQIDPTI